MLSKSWHKPMLVCQILRREPVTINLEMKTNIDKGIKVKLHNFAMTSIQMISLTCSLMVMVVVQWWVEWVDRGKLILLTIYSITCSICLSTSTSISSKEGAQMMDMRNLTSRCLEDLVEWRLCINRVREEGQGKGGLLNRHKECKKNRTKTFMVIIRDLGDQMLMKHLKSKLAWCVTKYSKSFSSSWWCTCFSGPLLHQIRVQTFCIQWWKVVIIL